ncbi:MAG: FAD-dependent oxidoreductase, partial [Acidobacteria bacterium]|nr:FAD-dependent oxidoreductase [Acidobacteriota bacterium]NIO58447.1 FAD-dependent oxidoreductase [Acidobacteriota bacterium]NIQ29501.1 FAD-dependent oxidoreductase [Acidobacteriota bacterium]NIQ84179.1 FAD-dependent oxidoreductase [Acidobacteriota bacterium]
EVACNVRVERIDERSLTLRDVERGTHSVVESETILWAAGIRASGLGAVLARTTGVETDRLGRVCVEPDLSVPGHPEIFVIGDLAYLRWRDGRPLPGVAPVAMQQGRYVARAIRSRTSGRAVAPFRYRNRGALAVIGRAAAVADLGRRLRFSGYPAWWLWLFVHIMYLVEFENRVLVFVQWAFSYFTRKRGARLITGEREI